MYGGSGKLGRGRGGGPVKRNIHSTFQPSSVQRPSATPGGGRLSAGGGRRNSTNTPAAPATVSTADETFSLVRNNPLNFGMIIRLAPVLVEEIKRLESEGGAARIKFDSSAKNPAGNVINVGGKEFRFTWSQETGDLCDIYEEQRGGDNGDGLLVESGGAWRKLNVQRELDDKFQNHVKMRTVQAELEHKSRKAIILDHGNPSMKNQMKAMAAAEVNSSWKSLNKKKEPPFKKQKAETSAVIPPKSGVKLSSSTPSKIRPSASPLLFTPEQSGAQLSPLKNNNFNKLNANREDSNYIQFSKENASTSEKEMPNRVPAGNLQNKPGSNERVGNKPVDLQSLLISLLMEKPQGMNIKALEKAVGETVPTSVKQIEPILKRIAVLKAPGRYILKPDVELDSSKKSLSESGSSPENNNHHTEATVPESSFPLKPDDVKEFEQPVDLISEPYEDLNIDIDHISPDVLSDKKDSHNNEGFAINPNPSLSRSESDSDSDSSDSESDSKSSSDSESDASSNSKQGSDVDVDIMSDDDKEPKIKSQPLDHEVTGYAHDAHNSFDEKDDHHRSEFIELEKDLFEDNQETDLNVTITNSFPDKGGDNYAYDNRNLYNNHVDHQETDVHGRNVHTSKWGSDEKHFDENENAKRLKSGNQAQTKGRNSFSESPLSDGPSEGPYKGTTNQMMGRMSDYDYEKVDNRDFFGNPSFDSPRSGSGPRSIDLNARAKAPADLDMGPQGKDVFFTQKDNKINKELQNEDNHFKGRKPPKNSGSKHSSSHQKTHGSQFGKIKEPGLVIKDSPNDMKNSPAINGRGPGPGPTLRRELSDLEMGEFRENLHEEPSGGNKNRFEKNNSFKQSENNKSSSDYWNIDESKGKPAGRTNLDPKKAVLNDHVDNFTKFNDKQISRLDLAKGGSHHNKGRHNEAGVSQGIGSEPHTGGQSQRKVPHKHEKQVIPVTTKDKKRNKSKDLGEKKKDFWNIDNNNNNNNRDNNNGQKRREIVSCSDESITSYIKYEKDVPEMKGPIRDLSQYNEYVQEYREKYDCYNMLNKTLEAYRNEFQNFGRDLELAKGRDNDRYNKILEQLMESYRQCGTKHKRMKKIFVVLHHELQHLKEMIKDFADKQTKG